MATSDKPIFKIAIQKERERGLQVGVAEFGVVESAMQSKYLASPFQSQEEPWFDGEEIKIVL